MRFLHTRLLQHRLIRVFGVIGSLTVGLVHSLVGHPISLSTAVADIYPDHLQVELRILVEDLVLYHQLKADGEQTVSREDLMTASELHRSFLKQYFRFFSKMVSLFQERLPRWTSAKFQKQGAAGSGHGSGRLLFPSAYGSSSLITLPLHNNFRRQ